MTQLLNHSDINLIRSASHAECFLRSPTQTASPADAWSTANRADCTRVTDRDIQALWPPELPLCRRVGARPQAISVDDRANRRASAVGLCTKCDLSTSCRVSWQLSQATGDAQRDLRDQCRASASSRESRLDGSGRRIPRLSQGGRHHRQHDRILSRWGRHATRPGRS
jgi:hypothetical protein